jgi:hypothetical protein
LSLFNKSSAKKERHKTPVLIGISPVDDESSTFQGKGSPVKLEDLLTSDEKPKHDKSKKKPIFQVNDDFSKGVYSDEDLPPMDLFSYDSSLPPVIKISDMPD